MQWKTQKETMEKEVSYEKKHTLIHSGIGKADDFSVKTKKIKKKHTACVESRCIKVCLSVCLSRKKMRQLLYYGALSSSYKIFNIAIRLSIRQYKISNDIHCQ